ncbi:imidazolonepropionase [Peribacillus sp. FSL H8-0477]|uniref:imidazolonepropionase n=1 Tax=Peribacillus sp. FSL H8-0477 TaxID=2921388 RepID=UPI0030FB8B68
MNYDMLVKDIGQLILPESSLTPLKGEQMKGLSIKEQAAFAVSEGKVAWIGSNKEAETLDAELIISADNKVVSPGLVDSHTHLVFGGSREGELELKQQGIPYLEILEKGGGILSTVAATRQSKEEELIKKAAHHLETSIAHGVTTLEAKSGYGLDKETELKQLRVVKTLSRVYPITLVSTFLGPHAIPPEYKENVSAFIEEMISLLDVIKEEELADFVDIFCETGVFSIEQSRLFLEAAKEKGYGLKMHADEINSLGGTELAVSLGAVSVDHLVAATDSGIEKLASSNTVAVLLPGTTFYLGKNTYAKARRIIDKGGAVALATDFNPGSSVTENLQVIMSLAALKLNMTAEEIWNAVTVNAAHAIGQSKEAGTLELGRKADFVIWDIPTYQYLPYHYGINHAHVVYVKGKKIWERARVI